MTNYSLYPASIEGFVGDTMPYFEDGTMNVFYLADQRNGKQGYHPWGLIQTKDFVNYDDSGVVINYGETVESQDIALGTGSVIKDKDGVYHAFYTGHNDTFSPKEAVMHATSNDMKSWTKIPEDTFTSTGNYSTNDFRDPYVYYSDEDKCYEEDESLRKFYEMIWVQIPIWSAHHYFSIKENIIWHFLTSGHTEKFTIE